MVIPGNIEKHIPNRISIDNRPKEVEKRIQLGHWEVDTQNLVKLKNP